MVPNGLKLSWMVPNGLKWSQMIPYGPNMMQMVPNVNTFCPIPWWPTVRERVRRHRWLKTTILQYIFFSPYLTKTELFKTFVYVWLPMQNTSALFSVGCLVRNFPGSNVLCYHQIYVREIFNVEENIRLKSTENKILG